MSIDYELLDEYKNSLADKYTAEELCELLELTVWDIIEAFPEAILELQRR